MLYNFHISLSFDSTGESCFPHIYIKEMIVDSHLSTSLVQPEPVSYEIL